MRRSELKAAADERFVEEARRQLAGFFGTQGSAVRERARTRRRLDDVFDADRWNRILQQVLLGIALPVSQLVGEATMRQIGLDTDDYDVDRTQQYLDVQTSGVAAGINATTRAGVGDALAAGDRDAALKDLFVLYGTSRAASLARSEVTGAAGFGTREAGQQSGRRLAKTWVVTSGNPRASHASLSGETVPLGETFSNGARWPGDSTLPDEERAGCTCAMEIGEA